MLKLVNADYTDSRGKHPLVFENVKSLEELHQWLFNHYNGYHFTIMFDETKDLYEEYGKRVYVYFSDEALEEIAWYAGYKEAKDDRGRTMYVQ